MFVAQRLNRQSIEDADEKRAKRFFADARLPSGERAELEDNKNSRYSRGHAVQSLFIRSLTWRSSAST